MPAFRQGDSGGESEENEDDEEAVMVSKYREADPTGAYLIGCAFFLTAIGGRPPSTSKVSAGSRLQSGPSAVKRCGPRRLRRAS